ncbi:MAG: DUF445 family protein [Treponema sp.]|nr:DUF445 family protein [Treponema sp.]
MNTIVLFVVPPIAGAIIAYITNVIAIKMLFRPLNEIRVFGIRVPFTPGILPRQRKKLAQSIGGMVERELLTPEVLRDRLAREDVREKIRYSISLFTENILDKTPSQLFVDNEKVLADRIPEAVEKIYPVFTSAVMEFLYRPDIRREMESKGRIILRNIILKLNIFQRFFLSAAQYDMTLEKKMPEIIDDLSSIAEKALNETGVKKTLITAAGSSFNKMIGEQDKNLFALLNIGAQDKVKLDDYIFNKLLLAADGQINNILTSINVKQLVSDRIDSLDVARVERIILDVMSDQFKWIHIFGGILGFIIGLFQATLTYFLR